MVSMVCGMSVNPIETQELFLNLLQAAEDEILLLFSTPNAFHRAEHLGLLSLLTKAASKRSVDIRVLVPLDNLIQKNTQCINTLKTL